MTHSHDDPRQHPSSEAADLEVFPVPEPLVPAEPPAPAAIEPSWRQILAMQTPPVPGVGPGGPEAQDPGTTPDAGAGAADPAGTGHVRSHDSTIGTLGDEPMGGVPRDTPVQEFRSSDPSEFRAPALLPREHPSTASRVGEELLAWLKERGLEGISMNAVMNFAAPDLPGDWTRRFAPLTVAAG